MSSNTNININRPIRAVRSSRNRNRGIHGGIRFNTYDALLKSDNNIALSPVVNLEDIIDLTEHPKYPDNALKRSVYDTLSKTKFFMNNGYFPSNIGNKLIYENEKLNSVNGIELKDIISNSQFQSHITIQPTITSTTVKENKYYQFICNLKKRDICELYIDNTWVVATVLSIENSCTNSNHSNDHVNFIKVSYMNTPPVASVSILSISSSSSSSSGSSSTNTSTTIYTAPETTDTTQPTPNPIPNPVHTPTAVPPTRHVKWIPIEYRHKYEYHYEIGDKVDAIYLGIGKWFPGVIYSYNNHGTYDIYYDDNEYEYQIPYHKLRYRYREELNEFQLDKQNLILFNYMIVPIGVGTGVRTGSGTSTGTGSGSGAVL